MGFGSWIAKQLGKPVEKRHATGTVVSANQREVFVAPDEPIGDVGSLADAQFHFISLAVHDLVSVAGRDGKLKSCFRFVAHAWLASDGLVMFELTCELDDLPSVGDKVAWLLKRHYMNTPFDVEEVPYEKASGTTITVKVPGPPAHSGTIVSEEVVVSQPVTIGICSRCQVSVPVELVNGLCGPCRAEMGVVPSQGEIVELVQGE